MDRNTTFEKMRMESADMIGKNVEKIAELFPECVTEAVDQDGKIRRLVDFEKLREILSGDVAEEPERYDFTWVGKSAALAEAHTPIRKTLRPCPKESRDWDTTQNLYIEGDNLDVLKLLQESYLGKVKVIYIDPPYNTGADSFVYPDNYRVNDDEYEAQGKFFDEEGNKTFKENNNANPRFHSDWCSMIYSRLVLARNMLTDDGVIFISIDEREHHNLRNICNEVLGESNFIGDLVWESTTQPINAGIARFNLQQKTETILLFCKDKSKRTGFELEELKNNLEYPHMGRYGRCRFEIIEKSDTGTYSRPSMKFQILGQYPRDGKRWQIGEETAKKLEQTGRVEIVDGIVKKAVYPEDETDRKQYVPFWSLLTSKEVGTALQGKEELNQLMRTGIGFDTVKPVSLLKLLLKRLGSNYVVLDFFSGSATTAHAVMQLNAEDRGNRRFILVQLPEICVSNSDAAKAGYSNICEIGKERIRRAGDKIKADNPLTSQNLDVGFRVLKVDSTNMNDVYYGASEVSQDLIKSTESNIKDDRTDLDLLFGCLIDWGVPLSYPYKSEEKDGATVHDYNDGDLIACFAESISEKVVEEIARRKPTRAVFRDSCFASDAAKINVTELFKRYSPDTRIKTI